MLCILLSAHVESVIMKYPRRNRFPLDLLDRIRFSEYCVFYFEESVAAEIPLTLVLLSSCVEYIIRPGSLTYFSVILGVLCLAMCQPGAMQDDQFIASVLFRMAIQLGPGFCMRTIEYAQNALGRFFRMLAW